MKVAGQNSNIKEVLENTSNRRFTKPSKTNGISVGPSSVSSTHSFFAPTHPPMGQKTSLVNFKHKNYDFS